MAKRELPKTTAPQGPGKVLATIYRCPDGYRLYWRAGVDGKPRSRFKDFPTYSVAKRQGEKVVADLAKGAEAAKLTPGQASDALAAFEGFSGSTSPPDADCRCGLLLATTASRR